MQYTPHYNLNLPEGADIVNPLVQDNPNYSAIDTALYNNKLRVIGSATHVKTGTNHAITLGDSDINQFKFVATGDYATGDTFTVDGVTVTPRIADGSTIPDGAFKINSTVLCILDGTVLNFIGVIGIVDAADVAYDNSVSGLAANTSQAAIDELAARGSYLIGYGTGISPISLVGEDFDVMHILLIDNSDLSVIKEYTFDIPHMAFENQNEYRFFETRGEHTIFRVGFTKDLVVLNTAYNFTTSTDISSTTSLYVYGTK